MASGTQCKTSWMLLPLGLTNKVGKQTERHVKACILMKARLVPTEHYVVANVV